MLYGICNLSIVPLRLEATDASEMVNQVLFGESFEVLEKEKKWSKIKLQHDGYEGFIDNKQYEEISETLFSKLSQEPKKYSEAYVDFVTDTQNSLTTIPLGARLPFLENNAFTINEKPFSYDGAVSKEKLPKTALVKKAILFLNAP